jgi:hypothetical protein
MSTVHTQVSGVRIAFIIAVVMIGVVSAVTQLWWTLAGMVLLLSGQIWDIRHRRRRADPGSRDRDDY